MITKTGITYSNNSDLTPGGYSGTIEENGEKSKINIPYYPTGVDLYVKAYCIEDGNRIESPIHHYMLTNWFYIKNEYAGQNTLTIANNRSGGNYRYTYSFDKEHWTEVTVSSTYTITMEEGEKVYFRGGHLSYRDSYGYNTMTCSQNYSIGGDMSTVRGGSASPTVLEQGGISGLFANSTTLVDASNLDFSAIDTIGYDGLGGTFYGCTNLVGVPDLSSIKYVYTHGMTETFYGTKINSIDLSGVVEVRKGGFRACFQNSKISSISMGNITTIGTDSSTSDCFRGCFRGCTNLVRGIDLSKITSINGSSQFRQMYQGCTHLEEATFPKRVTTLGTSTSASCYYWLRQAGTSVSGTKTVNCPTGVNVPTGSESGVPTGWTKVDY